MSWIILLLSVGLFALGLRLGGVIAEAGRAVTTAREAGGVIASRTLTDDEKEKRVQAATLSLFARFFSLLVRLSVCAAVAAAVVYAADLAGLVPAGDVLALSMSWPALLVASVLVCLPFVIRRQ